MFTQFFGLSENPFKLAVDPKYLFLGRDHEEAIAHLNYALMEGEGFIAITGAHGVGKTMVCQSFVEKLDPRVAEFVYVNEPASHPQELLKTIHAKLKIRSSGNSTKKLVDALNAFLMRRKLEGKKVALFIDNAHRLASDVLEQIRLISNLETSRDKLLQIVLIGQPELSDMLASHRLRQIGQRVSVGVRINALSFEETRGYIQHRLTIASSGPPVRFEQKAVRRIFKYSKGIPRTINIVCDRSLAVAHARNERRITDEIAKEAIRYFIERAAPGFWGFRKRTKIGWLMTGCCFLLMIGGAVYFFRLDRQPIYSQLVEDGAVSGTALPAMNPPTSPASLMPADTEMSVSNDHEAGIAEKGSSAEPAATQSPGPSVSAPRSETEVAPLKANASAGAEQVSALAPPAAESAVFSESTLKSDTDAAIVNQGPDETKLLEEASESPNEGSGVETDASPAMTHSVQVGAFQTPELAEKLAVRLMSKGYSARLVPITDARSRRWYTVRIGDHPSRESAQRQADSFTAQEKMETAVRPYNAF